jgi:DNA-binding transcriptional LysR family regulator
MHVIISVGAIMDRLDAMRLFVGVAELASFSAAARRFRVSAAAASRAVALIEDELGVSLFYRTTRTVRLTERGTIYLDQCKRILGDIEDVASLARGANAEPRGLLTVTAPIMFGRLHVLPVIEALLAANPKLAARLTLSDRNVHLADEGVDVAVRIGDLADSALVAVKVGEVRLVTVASPKYLAVQGEPKVPADLRRHSIISFEGIGVGDEWRFGSAGRLTTVQVVPRLSVNSADAAIVAASNGLGITRTLSYQVTDAVSARRLKLVLASFAPAAMPVSLVYPARRVASANVTAFLTAARAHFRSAPLVPE